MNAIWFAHSRWEHRELPAPTPAAGDILATVAYCGICNTDLELLSGYMDFAGVPGHEWLGHDPAGHAITCGINFGCGHCPRCLAGDPRHCSDRTVLGISGHGGAMAQKIAIPATEAIAVPDFIPPLQAVFLEPLAAALAIGEQIDLEAAGDILLIGSGKLGQLVADVLLRAGRSLFVIGRNGAKNAIIARKGGIILPEKETRHFATVIETSGNPAGFTLALEHLEPRGRLVLKSTYSGDVPVPLWRVVVDEYTLVGSRCGRIATAIAFWERYRPDYAELISAVYPLERFAAALRHARDPAALKVVLALNGG
jgi:threonine dehydrogenase-like Zn-dependent dehydrogenase